jgi:hypothetical protein
VLAFLSGLLAGCLHVVSGPDHVAAVAPLALRQSHHAGRVGASWGIGHGGGVLFWLILSGVVGKTLRLDMISELAEVLVGVSLVALGSFALWSRRDRHTHKATPSHRTALGMGVLHGSAGAGHFLVALPTLGLPPGQVIWYASGYLLSAIAVMAAASSLLVWVGARAPSTQRLQAGCAWLAILIGLAWLGSSSLVVL